MAELTADERQLVDSVKQTLSIPGAMVSKKAHVRGLCVIIDRLTASPWIPIAPGCEMPPRESRCLVFDAFYNRIGEGCWGFNDTLQLLHDDDCHITHWMPLPAPPEVTDMSEQNDYGDDAEYKAGRALGLANWRKQQEAKMSETIEVGDVVYTPRNYPKIVMVSRKTPKLFYYREHNHDWQISQIGLIRLGATAAEALETAQRREWEAAKIVRDHPSIFWETPTSDGIAWGIDAKLEAALAAAISAHVAASALLATVAAYVAREKGGEK